MKRPKILDRLANIFGYVKAGVAVNGVGFGFPVAAPSKTRNYLNAYKSWVYACVRARSQDVARIKLNLYRVVDRKTGEVEEVSDHDVLSLLKHPNQWQSMRDLIEATQAMKDLAGESFWYLNRLKNGRIVSIWPLRPDWITVNPDDKTLIRDYTYRPPGVSEFTIAKEDIVHFKEFSPADPYRGMSVIRAAAAAIDTEEFAEEYNRKFFQNSALPSIVLSTEQKLDKSIIARMRSQWENEYQGPDKAHRMAILEGGLTLQPFAMSQKEMEWLSGMNYERDKILALFQTPKTVLGMTEDVTVSNAEATDYVFSARVVRPLMEKLVDTLNEFLLPHFKDGAELFFGFDDPVPQDMGRKGEFYKGLFAIGAMSPNEIREAEGYERVPGLDSFYVPIGMMPIAGDAAELADEDEDETAPEAQEPAKARQRAKLRLKGIRIPPVRMKEKIADEVSTEVAKGVMATMRKGLKDSEARRENEKLPPSHIPHEQREALWKSIVTKAENYEVQYKQRLRQVFGRQEKETLERLEKYGNKAIGEAAVNKALTPSDIDKVLFSLRAETKLTAEITIPILKDLIEESGDDVFDLLGLPDKVFDGTSNAIQTYLKVSAVRGIKHANKVTRSKIRNVLVQSVREGYDIPTTAKQIKEVFKEADTSRATMIARTETLKASNYGTMEAYKQSGVVVGKQWYTALDEMVCEWCSLMTREDGNGVAIGLDQSFFDKDTQLVGSQGGVLDLSFEGVDAPPLHPNCRCTLLPIVRSRS